MNKKLIASITAFVLVVLIVVIFSSAYIITEREQAVITQLGKPVGVIAGNSPFLDKEYLETSVAEYAEENNSSIYIKYGAGLYFKVPFIQNVVKFDSRILEYDSDSSSITTLDKKRVEVNNFARWRISNPLLFLQRVQTVPQALARLDDRIYSNLRDTLAEYNFIEIIRSTNNLLEDTESEIPQQKKIPIQHGRAKIMDIVTQKSREQAESELGIQIIDVRIKQADLPAENLKSVFQNMEAERNRIAAKYREEGNREATYIRAETDRMVKSMIAEAEQKAKVIRGDADAEAAKIYAKGFVQEDENGNQEKIEGYAGDEEFFRFIRSLEALEMSLDNKTALILGTNNELLKMLEQPFFNSQPQQIRPVEQQSGRDTSVGNQVKTSENNQLDQIDFSNQ